MKKSLFLLLISAISLFSDGALHIVQVNEEASIELYDKDIVFSGNKIKIEIDANSENEIKLSYQFDDNLPQLLLSKKLKKGEKLTYPEDNQLLSFDNEAGKITFILSNQNNFQKKISLFQNPSTNISKEGKHFLKNFSYDQNRYINNADFITISRGTKEADIIIPKLEQVTVIIKTSDSLGSGVVIDDGNNQKYVLTNYHVIAPDEQNVYFAFKGDGALQGKNNFFKTKVLKVDMQKDLALLALAQESIDNREVFYLKLANESKLKKGMDIYSMGHPLGYYFAFEQGMLSNIVSNYSWATFSAKYLLQYSMNSNRGNSGSPIVNSDLELIGIGAFGNSKGNNLNFAISLIDINEFLVAKTSNRFQAPAINELSKSIIEHGTYKNATYAKIDRNKNGIPDAMLQDFDNDGIWDAIAYDTDEDGSYERITSLR